MPPPEQLLIGLNFKDSDAKEGHSVFSILVAHRDGEIGWRRVGMPTRRLQSSCRYDLEMFETGRLDDTVR